MPSSPLLLSHPTKFETKTLPVQKVKDPEQQASHKLDNKILDTQSKLVKDVAEDKVSLSQFCETVEDINDVATLAAHFRPDGFSYKERAQLEAVMLQVGKGQHGKCEPQMRALYQQIKSGSLKSDEAVEELNWQTQKRYGAVVAERRGKVYSEERSKLRSHLYIPRADKDAVKKDVRHKELDKLINTAIDLFPSLDTNKDNVVDRREARSLLVNYEEFGLTPAYAATLYSRHNEMAMALEPKVNREDLTLEDLNHLLTENYPENPDKTLRGNVTKISKRLAHQEKIDSPEQAPFKLGEHFQPNNVKQGREGSCWFLCNLPALNDDQINDLIKPEGDGYRMTLADGRTTHVSPLNEAERRVYSTGDGAWSGLLEKGLSQILAEQGEDINAGFARVGREMVSGKRSDIYSFINPAGNGKPDLRDRNDLFRVMDDALDSGSAVLCAALKSDFDDDISEISAGGHAYTVLDVDRENDVITVRNPWGHGERADLDGVNDGVFQLSGDQFFANYSYLYLDQDQSVA